MIRTCHASVSIPRCLRRSRKRWRRANRGALVMLDRTHRRGADLALEPVSAPAENRCSRAIRNTACARVLGSLHSEEHVAIQAEEIRIYGIPSK
jgi:hypothetical protein